MLEQMRKHSRSFIIYIFFGIIIAVFVINFGPQSAGCVAGTSRAGRVAGNPITLSDFNYAMAVSGLRGRAMTDAQSAQIRAFVMDRFLARELLAEEAARRGLHVGEKEINDMLLKGRYLALGRPELMVRGEGDRFDYDLFSRFVRYNWGITVRKFKEQQRREMMAERLRDVLRTSIRVSEDEAQSDWIHRNTRVTLDYVRFSPADFSDQVEIGKDELDAFIAKNKKKIEQHYKVNKSSYSKLPKQVRLQMLSLPISAPAKKSAAVRKLDRARRQLVAGKTMTEVAAKIGGKRESLGWRDAADPGLGDGAKDAIAKLKDGELSAVIAGEDKAMLLRIDGRREGDLTLKQAQRDIARTLLQKKKARELARQRAEQYIKRAKAGEKLSAMFAEEGDDSAASQPAGSATGAPSSQPAGDKPELHTTESFPLQQDVPGIGTSKQLVKAAFKLKKSGEVADRPFEVGNMFYLIALKERQDADGAAWIKQRNDLLERYRSRKARSYVRRYTEQLCETAVKKEEVSVNPMAMLPPAQPGTRDKRKPPAYLPCKTLGPTPFAAGG